MTTSDAGRRFHDLRLCCFQTLDIGRPVRLYVGNAVTAGSAEALFEHDITATLNTAVNIERAHFQPAVYSDRMIWVVYLPISMLSPAVSTTSRVP